MRYHLLLLAVISLLLNGCATGGSSTVSSAPPPSQRLPDRYSLPEAETPREIAKEGAIYSAERGLDLYRDGRAREIGDIIMVQVVETSKGSNKANTTSEREASIKAGITSFFGLGDYISRNSSVDAGITNDFEGTGTTDRNSDVTATISARVVDKTMDGNLLIRGYQEVRVNNETQFIILSGLVRPSDITADNTITSSRIADSRIEYSGKGVVADRQRPGWLTKTVDAVWPF